jgi:hypothetical protein
MRSKIGSLCLSLAMFGILARAQETPAPLEEQQAERAVRDVEAQKGGASADELKAMVRAIAALKGKVSTNALNRYTEHATAAITASITAAEHHGTRAFGAQQASQLLLENELITPKIAQGLEDLANSVRRPTDQTATTHFKRNWAEGQSRQFVNKVGPALKYEQLKPVSPNAEPAARQFERKVDQLHADVDAAKKSAQPQLPPGTLDRLKRIGDKAKEVKARIDDLKTNNPSAAKKAADDWGPGLVKAGAVGVEVYSLIKDWNNKSDLEKIRDTMKALGSVLGAIQLVLSAAVPEKLLVVAILGILAEILDLGISFFDGDGPKGKNGGSSKPPPDGSGDAKGKEGGSGGKTGDPKKPGDPGGNGDDSNAKDDQRKGQGSSPKQLGPTKEDGAGGGAPFDRNPPKGERASPGADPKEGEAPKATPKEGAGEKKDQPNPSAKAEEGRKALSAGSGQAVDQVKQSPSPATIGNIKKDIEKKVAEADVLKDPTKWAAKIAAAVAKALDENRYSDPEQLRQLAHDAADAVIKAIPESEYKRK